MNRGWESRVWEEGAEVLTPCPPPYTQGNFRFTNFHKLKILGHVVY